MRRLVGIGIGAVVSCVLVVVAPAGQARAEVAHSQISGSGSSWASTLVNQWIADVSRNGLQVVYTASGSAQGRTDFANGQTDYAVTDIPYQGTDPVSGSADTSNGRDYGDVPLAAGATTFPFHLTVKGKRVISLRLSGRTLARIFSGQIRNWDDPAITADNNGSRLPSEKLVPVVHSEGSAVSLAFSQYVATEFPGIWADLGNGAAPSPHLPAAKNEVTENGSDGVINRIASAGGEGEIGMDEHSFAIAKYVPVASMENAAGYYVPPNQYNVAIALRATTIDEHSTDADYMRPDLTKVYNAKDPRAYPLSGYTSMLIPTSASDSRMTTAKRQTLVDFGYYALCSGQLEAGPLGYAPLPLNLVKAGFTQLDRLASVDPGVDVTNQDPATCRNPTFLSNHLSFDYLGEIAPEPRACDHVGRGPCAGVDGNVGLTYLTASRARLVRGQSVSFSAGFQFAGNPGPGATAALQRRQGTASWATIRTLKATASGRLTAILSPTATASYRIRYAGDLQSPPLMTRTVRVVVTAHTP